MHRVLICNENLLVNGSLENMLWLRLKVEGFSRCHDFKPNEVAGTLSF